jgi:hypothetical protein
MTIEPKLRKLIKYLPIGKGLRIDWTGKLTDREYRREIRELRKHGDKEGAKKIGVGKRGQALKRRKSSTVINS